jgi:uncharacterized integral membrane protein
LTVSNRSIPNGKIIESEDLHEDYLKGGNCKMNYKMIIILVILCLIGILIIQNAEIVEIQVYFWTIAMSRVLLMLILLAIGIIAGWLLGGYFRRKKPNV